MLKNIQDGQKEYKHPDMFIQTFVKQDVVVMSGIETDNFVVGDGGADKSWGGLN